MKMQKFFSLLVLIIFLVGISVTLFAGDLDYNNLPKKVTLSSGANLRDTSNIKTSKVIGTVAKGETVEVLDVYADYYNITGTRKDKEKTGWMWQKLITQDITTPNGATTTGGSLRSGPSSKNAKSGTITKGNIRILNAKITWIKIKAKSGVGWVYKSAI